MGCNDPNCAWGFAHGDNLKCIRREPKRRLRLIEKLKGLNSHSPR